jgi:serine protease Do
MWRHRKGLILAAVLVPALIVPVSGRAQAQRHTVKGAADLSGSIEATTRVVAPSVVEIFTTSYTPGQGIVPRTTDLITTQRASGSGVIVDPSGYVVTNAHVVRGAQRLRVEVPIVPTGHSILATNSRTVNAQIVGVDPETDIAVIKLDDFSLPALEFADSDELKAGQLVLAMGSPLGLHNSVTLGVISSIARQLEPDSSMIYLQTDAPIHLGSSGGPLVDLRGRLVGINTLIFSQAGGYEGIGFAAPSNIVRAVYEQIRKFGRVRRGDIGVSAQTVTPLLAKGLRLPRDQGVIVADVTPASPAAQAGLRAGDLIFTMDGKPMENARQLQVGLYRKLIGDTISLEVFREGEIRKMPVTMAERQDYLAGLSRASDPRQNLVPRLGMLGLTLNQQLAQMVPVLRVRSGVLVASTVAGAIDAREGGLAVGDVISAVNGAPVAGLPELVEAVDRLKIGDPVVLHLERRGEMLYLAFTVE